MPIQNLKCLQYRVRPARHSFGPHPSFSCNRNLRWASLWFVLFVQYFLNHFAQSQEVNLHPFLSISLPAFGFSPFSSSRLWLLAASIGDNVQTPWQVWHVVTCGDPPHSTLHILHFKNSELLTRTKFINAIVPKNRAGKEPYQ